MKKSFLPIILYACCLQAVAQDVNTLSTDTLTEQDLGTLSVTARRAGTSRMAGAENGIKLNREELFRAACCNLGESFTTNPSVDVNYTDAATGARQIRLLGLSGTYVQMLTENMPAFRGAAAPFALGYVPGTWMQGIQVSKGASSVRNGFESITGQIDIEYLKPEADEGATINVYGNSLSRMEANAEGNWHLTPALSSELLAHYENEFAHHDRNHDGFLDQPEVEQLNLQNRWQARKGNYIFHCGLAFLHENRTGGQKHSAATAPLPRYRIGIETDRYEAYMKHAYILDAEHGSNIAMIVNAAFHDMDAGYGLRTYRTDQTNLYGQLLYETNIKHHHNLAAGLNLFHDRMNQRYRMVHDSSLPLTKDNERETTGGAYAQYTYTPDSRFTFMAGLRADRSSLYGTFVTPRLHLRYAPADLVTFRLSAGRGVRSPHALAENHNLLSSGRTLLIGPMHQESAWNTGLSTAFYIPTGNKTLKMNVEYYYTTFSRQLLIDYDSAPTMLSLYCSDGRSYSHTFQVDATYPLFEGLELTAAYRLNDVHATYDRLRRKPLTSRYKALLTASYKTPLGLWQADVTCQLNGSGRMPVSYIRPDGTPSWDETYPTYAWLSAQVTRWFRHCSLYVGGENLCDYRQKNPIIDADMPWSQTFDPTMVWAPLHGITVYAGIRVNLGKRQ